MIRWSFGIDNDYLIKLVLEGKKKQLQVIMIQMNYHK